MVVGPVRGLPLLGPAGVAHHTNLTPCFEHANFNLFHLILLSLFSVSYAFSAGQRTTLQQALRSGKF